MAASITGWTDKWNLKNAISGKNSITVRFSVDGGAMTYRVHTDTEDNPFSGGLFSQFGLSDTLY
ncbi:hypothetical protein ACCG62_003519 [Escherichia coli]|nr:hypothetical protein [Escherichia coli]